MNPATKLPHTPRFLKGQPAAISEAIAQCKYKSKSRKRSVDALMREKGYIRISSAGPVESQWAVA